jgi:hypothetical protein
MRAETTLSVFDCCYVMGREFRNSFFSVKPYSIIIAYNRKE